VVDKTLVLRKLSELQEYLEQIKEYTNAGTEQYSKEWRTQRIVERTLQIMIESCADIAGHIKLQVPCYRFGHLCNLQPFVIVTCFGFPRGNNKKI